MILVVGICQNTVKVWQIVDVIFTILRILIPIIIIVTSLVPLFKALISGIAIVYDDYK